MTARDVIAQALARTAKVGRWPTTAELAQLRHDNAALAKALGDVLDEMERPVHLDDTDDGCAPVRRLRAAITAALSAEGVTE